MLAYRHAFHAGNHADVFKHIVLLSLLRYLQRKDKALRIVDTHAGAGLYSLESAQAAKKGEYLQGIARLWPRDDLPAEAAGYLKQVRRVNGDAALRMYPGSPALLHGLLRPQDRLCLFELHPGDHAELRSRFATDGAVTVRLADGFAALKSQLPPPSRRALVLVDPSYEGHGDYERVPQTLQDALRRFAAGTYMIWYPLVAKPGAAAMVHALKSLAPKGWLHAQLWVQQVDAQGFGLAGSGIFVINPPHTLHTALRSLLPWLGSALGQHAGAGHRLEQRAG
jgi:23S rRNA (adenine2030-N6)-methyltransferase